MPWMRATLGLPIWRVIPEVGMVAIIHKYRIKTNLTCNFLKTSLGSAYVMAMIEDILVLMEAQEMECMQKYRNFTPPGAAFCPLAWDSLLCWPPTAADETLLLPCPSFRTMEEESAGVFASRICDENGQWVDNKTDFTQCLQYMQENGNQSWAPLAVAMVLIVGSIISMVALSVSLFIFLYFRSLRCSSSLRVHCQLFASLLVQGALMSAATIPTLLSHFTHPEWLCRCLVVLQMYTGLSSTNWMFIEGLHLHSRLTSRVFQKEAPLAAYHAFGWGLPFICTGIWLTLMFQLETSLSSHRCWAGYGRSAVIWIITGPMMAALAVNCLFLVDIIRILISRRLASNRTTSEIEQLRRAVKATALLFPLLGVPHLLFCINPGGDGALEEAYMLANAAIKSSQGFFVSILYCFMNAEVQVALRKAYMRSVSRRRCGRSGTSRQTSATYVTSQSETKKSATTAL